MDHRLCLRNCGGVVTMSLSICIYSILAYLVWVMFLFCLTCGRVNAIDILCMGVYSFAYVGRNYAGYNAPSDYCTLNPTLSIRSRPDWILSHQPTETTAIALLAHAEKRPHSIAVVIVWTRTAIKLLLIEPRPFDAVLKCSMTSQFDFLGGCCWL